MRLQVSRMLLLLAHRVSRDQGRGLLPELRRCAGRDGTRRVGRRGVHVLMLCPECSNRMSVIKTMVVPSRTLRLTECACGVRAETEEKVIRRLPMLPATVRQPPGNGPNNTSNRSATENTTLFLDPIRSDPVPLSDLRLDLSQEVDREKAAYEQDFLSFWDAIEPIGRRKGDKAEAQKVWRKKRRPNSANLIVGWKRYRNSCGDGYTMDADRWLRSDGWLKEWEAAPPMKEHANGISSQYPKLKEIGPGVLPPPRPRP